MSSALQVYRGYRGGSRDEIREVGNPGNNLYVTGLSTRVSEKDLEEHFSKEGKVDGLSVFRHADHFFDIL